MKILSQAGCVDEIVARLRGLDPAARPRWGRMTAPQMVCHLSDSYRGMMGLRAVSPAETWMGRNVIRLLALRLPVPWPKGVPTMAESDQTKGGTPPGRFEDDRERLAGLVGRFAAAPYQRDFHFAAHPIFGQMSDWEWMRWGYLHPDHHLRQFGV